MMLSPNDVAAAKRTARGRAQEARDGMGTAQRRLASQEISSRLLALPELQRARTVLTYSALPSEIDPVLAIRGLRVRGTAIAFPRIESPGLLALHLVDDELDLVAGPFGLAEPSDHASLAPRETIDAVIVPGVAFDERGRRLGYGGGYYDRLLPTLRPDCVLIGIAFDEQLLPEIPAEEHDACVSIVVTPSRVIRASESPAH